MSASPQNIAHPSARAADRLASPSGNAHRSHRRAAWGVFLVVLLAVPITGCGKPPRVPHRHLDLIAGLQTALSARNPDWLRQAEERVAQLDRDGDLTPEALRTFREILGLAKQGDWPQAEARCRTFAHAQRY